MCKVQKTQKPETEEALNPGLYGSACNCHRLNIRAPLPGMASSPGNTPTSPLPVASHTALLLQAAPQTLPRPNCEDSSKNCVSSGSRRPPAQRLVTKSGPWAE